MSGTRVLVFGTCRVAWDTNKIYSRDGLTYVLQPVHYSISLTDVFSNIEYLMGKPRDPKMIDTLTRWNSHKDTSFTERIDPSKCIVVIEYCATRYNTSADGTVIPYLSDMISGVHHEDPIAAIRKLCSYGFKEVVILPPIINAGGLITANVSSRIQLCRHIEHAEMMGDVRVFDWERLMKAEHFKDIYHFTDDFKPLLSDALHAYLTQL